MSAYDQSVAEFSGLEERAAQLDPNELTAERLRIRPAHESSAKSRVREALHGEKSGIWDFANAVKETDSRLAERKLATDRGQCDQPQTIDVSKSLPQQSKRKIRGRVECAPQL